MAKQIRGRRAFNPGPRPQSEKVPDLQLIPPAPTDGPKGQRMLSVCFDLGFVSHPRYVVMEVDFDAARLGFREPGQRHAYTLPVLAAFRDAIMLGEKRKKKK